MKKLCKFLLLYICLASACTDVAHATCRSTKVKHKFDISQGYPHGRPGFIVDHICALANGGLDIISNMQYQTPSASQSKDRIENTPKGKVLFCTPTNSLPTRTVFNC
jgi:hypothetical protein